MINHDYNNASNPYRSPRADAQYTAPQNIGELVDSRWLYRKVRLPDPYSATIEYNGRGIGFETVLVDGKVVVRKTSLVWFVPRFDFALPTKSGSLAASLEVRVWPWLAMSRFVIQIEGKVVYAET